MLSAIVRPGTKVGKTRCSAHTNPIRPGLKGLFWKGEEWLQRKEELRGPSWRCSLLESRRDRMFIVSASLCSQKLRRSVMYETRHFAPWSYDPGLAIRAIDIRLLTEPHNSHSFSMPRP